MEEIIDVNTLFGPLPSASSDMTADTLLMLMQRHNVRAACTLSTLGILLDPTVGNTATRAAHSANPALLPVATLNPALYFGDEAAIARLVDDGFRLARFFPHVQGWPIEFAPFHDLVERLEPTGLPVMIDVEMRGEITALMRVLETHQAPVILVGVDAPLLAEAVAALRDFSNWYLEISQLLSPGCLQLVADTLGAERLLFGTGAPSRPIASALQTLHHSGLSDEARRQILAGNAHRILKG
jgi:predicted TIM-barrel fold metal-dependent hydrolase